MLIRLYTRTTADLSHTLPTQPRHSDDVALPSTFAGRLGDLDGEVVPGRFPPGLGRLHLLLRRDPGLGDGFVGKPEPDHGGGEGIGHTAIVRYARCAK